MTRWCLRLACVGLACCFGLSPVHAQSGTVRSVSLFADLATDDGSAIVNVEIEFVPDDTAGLRIELLHFANSTADECISGADDGRLIRFGERSGSRVWVVIGRDDFERAGLERVGVNDAVSNLPADHQVWRLVATCVIQDVRTTVGESARIHVPVLTVALPPQRDAGDIFRSEIRLPSNWSVSEKFPTGLRAISDTSYAVEMPVAPAVISLRARTDGAWRPGVPLLLDVLAGLILLGFVIIGGRHLRAGARIDHDGAASGRESRA